jgi:hypothetical protein
MTIRSEVEQSAEHPRRGLRTSWCCGRRKRRNNNTVVVRRLWWYAAAINVVAMVVMMCCVHQLVTSTVTPVIIGIPTNEFFYPFKYLWHITAADIVCVCVYLQGEEE